MSADTEFFDLVEGVQEMLDAAIGVINGADRLFATGRAVAKTEGLSRRRERSLPPTRTAAAIVAAGHGRSAPSVRAAL